VKVDLEEGLVEWKVGEEVRHGVEVRQLLDSKVKWVPFIAFTSK
jgi:hypothetical protein